MAGSKCQGALRRGSALLLSAPEPERTRLFNAQADLMPNFAEYQKNTDRTIPVITISRA